MARRAGVIPFSLAAASVENGSGGQRNSPARSHSHSQSHGSMARDARVSSPRSMYSRGQPMANVPAGRTIVSRRESIPQPPPPPPMGPDLGEVHYVPGPGLPPIQNQPQPRAGMLPGVAELTTGMSPYTTPATQVPPMPTTASPGPLLPHLSGYSSIEPAGAKRRASPDRAQHETSHRRRMI